MWNHTTDRMFLELRDDAVLLFSQSKLKLIELNPAAKRLFPDAEAGTDFTALFHEDDIIRVLNATLANGHIHSLNLTEQKWFPGRAVLHAATLSWNGEPAVAIAIDRRAYGPPQEALDLMRAVLNSAYFTSVRIDLRQQTAAVISDKNVLMNTQAHFPSYEKYIAKYAEAVIHPEDQPQFLETFSDEQIRAFLERSDAPSCTVRRMCDDEYRWASFSLTAAGPEIILLLGKDSNEMHLQQEELETVSLRNDYILTSISDIFRLMLHIDLLTGETVVCSAHPDLSRFFSVEELYQFQTVTEKLITMVHPDDVDSLMQYLTLDALRNADACKDNKIAFEYRRIDPADSTAKNAKWTRSVLTFTAFDENHRPTEAVYAVQDIDAQKRQELDAKRRQESLTSQFYTVIQNRYLWFISCDFSTQTAHCYRIKDHTVLPPADCPFGQFFERMIMPNCHPEDYKRVAMALLPSAAAESYRIGKRQVSIDYRHKTDEGWRYVRAEMYMQQDDQGVFRSMIYVSDIDDEVKSQIQITQSEHEQLMLRRKLDKSMQKTFRQICEIDPDTDQVTHYHVDDADFITVGSTEVFSTFCETYPERYVHPEHRVLFRQLFSYDQILRGAREHLPEMQHLFLMDPDESLNFIWCNFSVRFFTNENGKSYMIASVEDINEIIQKRDANLHAVYAAKEQLQENMREVERSRIRRAHVFMNIASSFQLALNRLYGNLDELEHSLPESKANHAEFSPMYRTYEQLSSMTETAKDMLLLENNQLAILNQPMSFLALFRRIKQTSGRIFDEKRIRVLSYATHVTDETVLCDADRLTFLLDQLFLSVIRALPDTSSVTLQLAQSPIPGQLKQAVYEFSLVTRCQSAVDSLSQLHAGAVNDPIRTLESEFLSQNPDYQPHNLYFCKRLIERMHGTLDFVRMPDHACAVILRLPLGFVRQQIIFPLRYTFGKRALVWDSKQPAAISTMEMLRESGIQSDWHADFENVKAYLKLAQTQDTDYDLVVVRASDLIAASERCLDEITAFTKERPLFVIEDALLPDAFHADARPNVRMLKTPVFRSTLAAALRQAFEKQK